MSAKRADPALVAKAREALEQALPKGAVRDEPDLLEAYGHDESDTGDFPADLVVFHARTEQVQAVFRICQSVGVPVTPVAARSGKSGGSLPLYGGVSMSLERMNRIKHISTEDLICIVEPGVVTGELMKAVEAKGLFYPPDPNSLEFCSIGGNVAENAGGPRALKYGVTRDYVIGLEWVLPTGEAMRVGRRTIKGVAGYDLVGLFVGSEGTLGVATEITLQLLPLPKRVMTALVVFPSVLDASSCSTTCPSAPSTGVGSTFLRARVRRSSSRWMGTQTTACSPSFRPSGRSARRTDRRRRWWPRARSSGRSCGPRGARSRRRCGR